MDSRINNRMNKKLRVTKILSMVILLCVLCGCAKKDDYPKIAYIDNVSYYGTDEMCETVPKKAPDGIIETFVDENIMPDAYNSANFGSEQGKIEYIFLENNQLIVHLGEDWYYFEPR